MAQQHFYSRVPARVSMYNRADSFDTFAHSAGLERGFIEGELDPVYENKLNKNDVTVIRRGEMPCVYAQCTTRSGALVQNCIGFLPLDYTGERSAYLSHSLIFSPEEKAAILGQKTGAVLNPAPFVTDVEGFALTSPEAQPQSDLPEVAYAPSAEPEPYLASRVSSETAKAFLFAVLNALCGKGKNIFFKLRGEDKDLSIRGVNLFNEVLAVLPMQLRGGLSFVSYINDPAQYQNFKLKGVSQRFPDHQSLKGVYFDLQTDIVVGLRPEDLSDNRLLLEFFYSILKNKGLREEFLTFMEQARKAVPALQSLNLKTLADLVFLFRCSCGLYTEAETLPDDDRIYEYLCAYEKYRVALSEEYRMQAYKCLQRYPKAHMAIPKNIFTKVSRLYTGESQPAKRVVMNVVLELIHTDIMRDKLFTFIRSNYAGEEESVKRLIIADLSRVFYGGFLQNQILTFFDGQFETESEDSRGLMMEKLLLSIRTPAVQGKILEFIDRHYPVMSEAHRSAFYHTFLEMLPECDELARTLVQVVNRHIAEEPVQRKAALTEQLTAALESDYRRREHRLMPVLCAHPGFCRELVVQLAFGPWQGRKLREEYVALLAELPLAERTAELARIFALVPDLPQEAQETLLAEAVALYDPNADTPDLYGWLEAAETLKDLPADFAAGLNEAVFLPAMQARLHTAFDPRQRLDGPDLVEAYADASPALRDCAAYAPFDAYRKLLQAAEAEDVAAAAEQAKRLRGCESALPLAAAYLSRRGIDPKAQSPVTVLTLQLLLDWLKGDAPGLAARYTAQQAGFLQAKGPEADAHATRQAAEEAASLLLQVGRTLCAAEETLREALCAPGEQAALAAAFVTDHGKGARHWLQAQAAADPFTEAFAAAVMGQKPAGTSIFAKLFGKK